MVSLRREERRLTLFLVFLFSFATFLALLRFLILLRLLLATFLALFLLFLLSIATFLFVLFV